RPLWSRSDGRRLVPAFASGPRHIRMLSVTVLIQLAWSSRHPLVMHWKTIRLELARTPEFPRGSASRAHLLRLPVNDQGVIDEEALRAAPGRATVRRFWPNEPDMAGHVVRTVEGWAFSYSIGEKDELILHLESGPMRQGEQ